MSYMDLNAGITKVQKMNRDMVHTFAAEVLRPASLDLDKLDPEDVIERESIFWEVFRKGYKIGMHKILLPEIYGGGGFSPLEVHMLFEEISWGSVDFMIAFGVACFPAFIASMVPTEFLIENIIIPFCEDEEAKIIGCWAITEPDHGSDTLGPFTAQFSQPDIAKTACRATLDGDDYVINGTKAAWVSNGTIATSAALFCAVTDGSDLLGGGIFLVPLELPGVSRGKPLNKIGQRPLNQGELFFDDVRIPAIYQVSGPETYDFLVDQVLCLANAGMGVTFVGLARAALEEAVAYAKERVQGGLPIIEHQSVKARLFKMFTSVEAARSLARRASYYNATHEPLVQYSIASKVFATNTAFEVASGALQIFGGNGLSREYPIEKMMRDARASMIEDGCNDILSLVGAEKL